MKSTIRYILVLTTAILFVSSFQNCSEPQLILKQKEFASTKLDGEFCSLPSRTQGVVMNFIFIVDMSGSNVRSITNTGYTEDGATDPDGVRFQMIEDFIQSDCIQDKSQVKFTVLGFSSSIMPAPQSTTCHKNRLVSSVEVLQQLNSLKNTQDIEPPLNPGAMQGTFYEDSLGCATDIISSHISSLASADKSDNFYQVMFLSDGVPTNSKAIPLQNMNPIYSDVDNLQDVAKLAGGAVVQPILYGADKLNSTDYETATTVMKEMAKRGDSLESAVQDATQINFCELLNAGKRTPFVVTSFGAVNLTATMKNGELKADSDMDGIPDSEEEARGFNPIKARSRVGGSEILDGVCPFDAGDCVAKTCSAENALGLSDCEITDLSLTDAIDSDKDGVPDLVEILKGTLPSLADMDKDIDGDGVLNGQEIQLGRDPNYSDNDVKYESTIDITRKPSDDATASCPSHQQRWVLEIKNIPLVDTLNTYSSQNSLGAKWRQHTENENVILVYYTVQEENAISEQSPVMYGAFVKIKKGVSARITSFEKIGDVNGTFKTKP